MSQNSGINGWVVESRLDSWGNFDKGMHILRHPDPNVSLRLLVTRGKITMLNPSGEYVGDWNGHAPELSSSALPVVAPA